MWGSIFKLLLGAAAIGLTVYATYKIYDTITKKRLAEEAAIRCKEAFKAEIQSKKRNSVHVGLFDEYDNEIDEFELESPEGVSSDVRVGDVILLSYGGDNSYGNNYKRTSSNSNPRNRNEYQKKFPNTSRDWQDKWSNWEKSREEGNNSYKENKSKNVSWQDKWDNWEKNRR